MEISDLGVTDGADLTAQRKMLMLLKSLPDAVKRYVASQDSVAGE
jgi:hypothetical protein